jgi:hypothetical protein
MNDHIPDATKMVCPFCGADAKPIWAESITPWFTCGTMVYRRDINRHDQTEVCEQAERARLILELTTLRTANAALVERVKRLEEAGDAMLNAWLMPEDAMEYSDWVALSSDAKRKWYRAKATT